MLVRSGGVRTAECVSDLRLDAFVADEASERERSEIRRHTVSCVRCRRRVSELAVDRKRFAVSAMAEPAWLVARKPRRRLRGVVAIGAAIAGMATLVLVSLDRGDTGELRLKGGEHVSFYIKRGDAVHRGRSGSTVQPGDRLRFAYTTAEARYLAILSLDGAHRASVYYPGGDRAVRVEPGTDVLLPVAVELDETVGRERVHALFCAEPVALSPLLGALGSAESLAAATRGCSIDSLELDKRGRAP